MKALITGATGFVGRHLERELDAAGVTPVGFSLGTGDDVRCYEQVRAAVDEADPDYIFHLAAQVWPVESLADPRRSVDINVAGTLNVLEAVRNTGCRARVLIAGSSEEYGYDTQPAGRPVTEESVPAPTSPYGVSKLAAGQIGLVYARRYGIPVVVTRAWNHTGPGQTGPYAVPAFARRIVAVERGHAADVVHGALDAVRNYTDVRDVVAAYRLAVDLPSGIYNVCSDRSVPLRWILDTLVAHAKVAVATRLDGTLHRGDGSAFPEPCAGKLADATGWKPRIPLEQTLADVLTWWRERP